MDRLKMQATLPDIGVDVGSIAQAIGVTLGVIFIAIISISAVFIAGSIGWRWLNRAGGLLDREGREYARMEREWEEA